MINGTSVMSGIAANCVYDARILLALAMGAHALAIQALSGSNQSFHPFIHNHKPHPGQKWAAGRTYPVDCSRHCIRRSNSTVRRTDTGKLELTKRNFTFGSDGNVQIESRVFVYI